MTDFDVVVVGGGPVGETLLVHLGHRGILAVGFERDADIWPKPRAVHFDGEVFRSFQPVGLAETIAGLCEPMLNNRMENEAGEVLLDFSNEGVGVHGWIASSMFNQPELDVFLRSEIERLPSVELRTGCEVTQVSQTADEVTLVVRDASGDEPTVTAEYVIGCDGGTSETRRRIGAEWEILGPDDLWLVVDGELADEPPVRGSMVTFAHYTRPHMWAKMPNGRARMEFKVMPGDDLDEIITPEAITRLSRGLLTPDNFHLVRTAVYTFRSRVAIPWRSGRILLAGDAAHLTPPLFGQGLCSGMRDVVNLSWKLDLVLNGAPDSLLDTYESERSAHARGWIVHATEMSKLLQTTDPVIAAQRDAHMRAHPEQRQPVPPPLGPGLHTGLPPAGTPAPQPALPDGRRFDDLLGRDFALVTDSSLRPALPPSLLTAVSKSPRFTIVDDTAAGTQDFLLAIQPLAEGTRAAVIRPDRYLLGVARTAEELADLARFALSVSGTGAARALPA